MCITSTLDGLICLAPKIDFMDPVVILNPLLSGDCVFLPEQRSGGNHGRSSVSVTLGFDESIKRYKVVRMDKSIGGCIFCDVITIGKVPLWRGLLARNEGLIEFHSLGVYHQGSVYWMMRSNGVVFFLELDLTKEVFVTVGFPGSVRKPLCRSVNGFTAQLQSVGEALSLTEIKGSSVHIWQLVKQNETRVVGCRSIETRWYSISVRDLIHLNGNEDFLLLQTKRDDKVRNENGVRITRGGTRFSNYRLGCTDENNQLEYLPALESLFPGTRNNNVKAWCFKPSFVSIKEAADGFMELDFLQLEREPESILTW